MAAGSGGAATSRSSRWSADLALVAVTLVWGTTFVVVKQALADVSTFLFLALRFTLGAAILGLLFRPGKARNPRTLVTGGVLAGVFLFAGFLFQTVGLRYTTPSKSAFITGLSMVIVPVLAAVIERKKPTASEALGIGIATAGMALMTLEGATLSIGKGDLLTLAGAVVFAGQIIAIGHCAPRLGFGDLSFVQIGTVALLSMAGGWFFETPEVRWTPGLIGALLITGVLATAVAFAVQAWAQRYTSPTRAALIFALEPVFAWLTSFLLTGELLSRRATAGACLILAGILLVELKPLSPRARAFSLGKPSGRESEAGPPGPSAAVDG
jgi:drug/metabolite transporter (DMT)-like permease